MIAAKPMGKHEERPGALDFEIEAAIGPVESAAFHEVVLRRAGRGSE
jgi:hypothetical protein